MTSQEVTSYGGTSKRKDHQRFEHMRERVTGKRLVVKGSSEGGTTEAVGCSEEGVEMGTTVGPSEVGNVKKDE